MQTDGVKKLLDRFGFGWFLSSREEIKRVTLSDIEVIPLLGNFDSGFALGEYRTIEGAKRKRTKVGDLLHKFKYEQNRHAGMILADLASDFINSQIIFKSSDLMLTVPPSFKSRSFDPVCFLAERIEERTQIRWERDVLTRTKLTKPQKSIHDREFKKINVLNTFQLAEPLKLDGKRILLIDDILASGATLNEVSAILREAKADKINVLVLTKTVGFKGRGFFKQ
ncbi:MAG: ComF family protein [candidate division Zixibacteria bacterium]|nr:ComF family protein [candidate division Zixibacteria bacterium]